MHRLHTRENKNEEGTDPSDDADDFAHVGNVHGDEERDSDPDHSENDSASTLKSLGDDSCAVPLEAHHQVQDDGSDPWTLSQHKNDTKRHCKSTVVCLTSPEEE